MKDMEYKGYVGSAEISEEDGVFHGKLLHIRDLITYESETAPGLVAAFHAAVDDYLADCAEESRDPDTPFKGSLNVRLGADLHRRLGMKARRDKVSINHAIVAALTKGLDAEERPETPRHAIEEALGHWISRMTVRRTHVNSHVLIFDNASKDSPVRSMTMRVNPIASGPYHLRKVARARSH